MRTSSRDSMQIQAAETKKERNTKMKKLMIAAAAALCATVGMSEGVSSQNIVG